jgi:hypothetical protein
MVKDSSPEGSAPPDMAVVRTVELDELGRKLDRAHETYRGDRRQGCGGG